MYFPHDKTRRVATGVAIGLASAALLSACAGNETKPVASYPTLNGA